MIIRGLVCLLLLTLPQWALGSATTGKQLDVISNSTGGSALSVPGTGTTFATDTNTLTLSSKTISGANNTLTSLPPTGLSITQWIEAANSATPLTVANYRVYDFAAGQAQIIFATIQVPALYISGNPIKLRMNCFSANYTSGTDLILGIGVLILPGSNVITSTANQHTSSNTAVTPAGTAIPYTLALDLTDTSGKINSVPVAAGSIIGVQVTRSTDTDTSDIQCLSSSEVTFQ